MTTDINITKINVNGRDYEYINKIEGQGNGGFIYFSTDGKHAIKKRKKGYLEEKFRASGQLMQKLYTEELKQVVNVENYDENYIIMERMDSSISNLFQKIEQIRNEERERDIPTTDSYFSSLEWQSIAYTVTYNMYNGLQELFEKNETHKDIFPSNILFRGEIDPRIKIDDIKLADLLFEQNRGTMMDDHENMYLPYSIGVIETEYYGRDIAMTSLIASGILAGEKISTTMYNGINKLNNAIKPEISNIVEAGGEIRIDKRPNIDEIIRTYEQEFPVDGLMNPKVKFVRVTDPETKNVRILSYSGRLELYIKQNNLADINLNKINEINALYKSFWDQGDSREGNNLNSIMRDFKAELKSTNESELQSLQTKKEEIQTTRTRIEANYALQMQATRNEMQGIGNFFGNYLNERLQNNETQRLLRFNEGIKDLEGHLNGYLSQQTEQLIKQIQTDQEEKIKKLDLSGKIKNFDAQIQKRERLIQEIEELTLE